MRDREHWTEVATEWIRWAREPGHDAFWAYRDALIDWIGEGSGEALEVGCGEGRVSRALAACGYRVTACDPVGQLVEAAREAGSASAYVAAAADALPFPDRRFDLVVAYNMLMDLEDIDAAVAEMARLLRDDGTLFVSIVHPIADLPAADDVDSYFAARRFETLDECGGLTMRFAGWARPLEQYLRAIENAQLAVVSLREPRADATLGREHMALWSRLPLFLWLKARRVCT